MSMKTTEKLRKHARHNARTIDNYVRLKLRMWVHENVDEDHPTDTLGLDQGILRTLVRAYGGDPDSIVDRATAEMVEKLSGRYW